VFFVTATFALVAVSVMLCVALYYAIRVLRRAERIGALLEEEARAITGDLDELRAAARREAGRLGALISSVKRGAARVLSPRSSRG
jgi:hypothetical protein